MEIWFAGGALKDRLLAFDNARLYSFSVLDPESRPVQIRITGKSTPGFSEIPERIARTSRKCVVYENRNRFCTFRSYPTERYGMFGFRLRYGFF